MVDFTDALNTKVEDIAKPKPRPVGTYMASVQNVKQTTRVAGGEEKQIISFALKLQSPMQDVDQEALADHGAEVHTWPPVNYDLWIDSPEGLYRLKTFLVDTLGLDPAGKSVRELCTEATGKQLLASLIHKPYVKNDQPEIATNVGSVAKV